MNKKHDPAAFHTTVQRLEAFDPGSPLIKERIYNRLIDKMDKRTMEPQIQNKDGISMKQAKWRKGLIASSLVLCLGGAFSTTSYAHDLFQSIAAKFQVGNMTITKYEGELPASYSSPSAEAEEESGRPIEVQEPASLSVDEARAAIGLNFPAPTWMEGYEYVNSVLHGTTMAEVQYASGDQSVNLLISTGGENEILTTDEVTTELIDGVNVYKANGIVMWESHGFTVELYAQEDFDNVTLGKIIDSFSVGAPVKPLTEDEASKNVQEHSGATAAPAR